MSMIDSNFRYICKNWLLNIITNAPFCRTKRKSVLNDVNSFLLIL